MSSAAEECNALLLEMGAIVRQAQVISPMATSLESERIECAMCPGDVSFHAMSDMTHV